MTENEGRPNEPALDSWKEIAAYLKRDVRTVKRWEKSEGLPVRRHTHQARSTVYAYPSELEAWKVARQPAAEKAAAEAMPWRRPAPALALTAMLLLGLVSVGSGPILAPPDAMAMDPEGMVIRQVLAGPYVDVWGAPSPDGRYLSYVDWETGDMAVYDLTTDEVRRLTNKGTWSDSYEFASFSRPSPDGKQIAYSWHNKDGVYDLRVVRLDGSAPRVVYSHPEVNSVQPHDWSPDGKQILVLITRKDGVNRIALVSVADGSLQVLKILDWRYPLKVSLSPDERYIVYDFPPRQGFPERDIFLLATDGSREIPLIQHPANDLFPAWAPDGKTILFTSDRTGSLSLWRLKVSEGKVERPPELVKPDVGAIWPMGFTGDGSYYYGVSTGMNEVYIATLDPETGKVVSPPAPVSQRYVGAHWAPDWSADGEHLAYVRQQGPIPREVGSRIVIRSMATGEEREMVPKLTQFDRRPRWSPDGRSFLDVGRNTKGHRGIFLIDAKTGAAQRLVAQESEEGYFEGPAWSPDGTIVFYIRAEMRGGDSSWLWARNLATGQDKELFGGVADFSVSPDGQQLVFRSGEQITHASTWASTLMVMPAVGGEARELLRVLEPEFIPPLGLAWTSDGRHVLFRTGRVDDPDQRCELWRISVDGGKPEKVGLAMKRLRELRVHPDGRRIVFAAGSRKTEVWVMENFLPELKAAK
jgi:Tol biopolymer transport system component